jgi:hypothetical protein
VLEIFVDGDGCPVKEEVFRVAGRGGLKVWLVSNKPLRVPDDPLFSSVVVKGDFDAADDWIVDHAEQRDIVVTADIPLAARVLEKGARVLGPSGRPFTPESIGDALAGRELAAYLRESGIQGGGPPPFQAKDRSRFLHALQEIIQGLRREP